MPFEVILDMDVLHNNEVEAKDMIEIMRAMVSYLGGTYTQSKFSWRPRYIQMRTRCKTSRAVFQQSCWLPRSTGTSS